MEMAAIFDLRALTKVHSFVIYKSAVSNAMRSGTHVADKKYYEETHTSVLTFVEYFIFNNYWCDIKIDISDFLGELLIMFYEISFYRYVFRILLAVYMYGKFDHFSTLKCQQLKIH